MKCNKEESTSFHGLHCILGKCKNNCQIVDVKKQIRKSYHLNQKEKEVFDVILYVSASRDEVL